MKNRGKNRGEGASIHIKVNSNILEDVPKRHHLGSVDLPLCLSVLPQSPAPTVVGPPGGPSLQSAGLLPHSTEASAQMPPPWRMQPHRAKTASIQPLNPPFLYITILSYYQTHHQIFLIQQLFIEYLLCTRSCSRCLGIEQSPCSPGAYTTEGETNHKQELPASTAGGHGFKSWSGS